MQSKMYDSSFYNTQVKTKRDNHKWTKIVLKKILPY